jgi:hypothetical protein
MAETSERTATGMVLRVPRKHQKKTVGPLLSATALATAPLTLVWSLSRFWRDIESRRKGIRLRLSAQRTVHDIDAHDYSRMSAVLQSFRERHRQEMADCAFERPVTATIADIAGAREAEVRPTILDHRGPSCSTVTLHDIEDGILAEPKPMTDFPV